MFLSLLMKFKSGSLYQITILFATEPSGMAEKLSQALAGSVAADASYLVSAPVCFGGVQRAPVS